MRIYKSIVKHIDALMQIIVVLSANFGIIPVFQTVDCRNWLKYQNVKPDPIMMTPS